MLIPKKSLGQNFLLDKNLCKKIVKSLKVNNKTIIEIGPGTGQLTDEIIKFNPKKLVLIEKDNKLIKILKTKYSKLDFIEILNIDALKIYSMLIKCSARILVRVRTKMLVFKTDLAYNFSAYTSTHRSRNLVDHQCQQK